MNILLTVPRGELAERYFPSHMAAIRKQNDRGYCGGHPGICSRGTLSAYGKPFTILAYDAEIIHSKRSSDSYRETMPYNQIKRKERDFWGRTLLFGRILRTLSNL